MAVFNKNRECRQDCLLSDLITQLNTVIRRNACEALEITEYREEKNLNTSFKRVTSIMLSLLMLMSFAVCFTAPAEDGKTITGSSVLNFDKKDEEYTFIPDKSDYYNFRSRVIEFGMV